MCLEFKQKGNEINKNIYQNNISKAPIFEAVTKLNKINCKKMK